MYVTIDTLTLNQANAFISLVFEYVGVDCELNASPNGLYNNHYVSVFELETNEEFDLVAKFEKGIIAATN
tara:strand:+ start:377 stop:586 length:210 start_codon:yes stop_codon:yes gene_type:complete